MRRQPSRMEWHPGSASRLMTDVSLQSWEAYCTSKSGEAQQGGDPSSICYNDNPLMTNGCGWLLS